MAEFDRLSNDTEWIDLDVVERERTPRHAIKVGIQLYLAGLSLSNTKQHFERLGVERSRTAIHDWVQKADLQPDSDADPNHIALDETVIQLNVERHWLYAAVDPETNQFLHVRLFQTRTTQVTVLFLRELREKQQLTSVVFLVDDTHHLKNALDRLGLRLQVVRHGNRNSIERIFRETKRRASSFSNTFSNAVLPTADRGSKRSPPGGIDAKVNTTPPDPLAACYRRGRVRTIETAPRRTVANSGSSLRQSVRQEEGYDQYRRTRRYPSSK